MKTNPLTKKINTDSNIKKIVPEEIKVNETIKTNIIKQIIINDKDKYVLYVGILFIMFLLGVFIIDNLSFNPLIKFFLILFSFLIVEDIHHTVKFIYNK